MGIKPKTDYGSKPATPGHYLLEIEELVFEEKTKDGKVMGDNAVVTFKAVGGHEHPEDADFTIKEFCPLYLAGSNNDSTLGIEKFMGICEVAAQVYSKYEKKNGKDPDESFFDDQKTRKRLIKELVGTQIGIKLRHRVHRDDKNKPENEKRYFNDIEQYITKADYQALPKAGKSGSGPAEKAAPKETEPESTGADGGGDEDGGW